MSTYVAVAVRSESTNSIIVCRRMWHDVDVISMWNVVIMGACVWNKLTAVTMASNARTVRKWASIGLRIGWTRRQNKCDRRNSQDSK